MMSSWWMDKISENRDQVEDQHYPCSSRRPYAQGIKVLARLTSLRVLLFDGMRGTKDRMCM